ncbi:DUF4233 domain-containing protein [Galactobacter caseinivorans]|uniref:DUF4233 domain-containing protein n=1 Tax=Galactobacter caseinivorans TaxID=2676123 RepID=A0A496PH12_9MICC|nr:DUF4233 domain-containing protein [Galactobacter caseinivorans]RKW69771.1 DUF4233 domain-containing protein [Galactobacter caseinivorans]
MAKMTKSQLAWRPGMPKKRRSTRVMFASVILTLEALAVLFAGLAMFGLRGRVEGGGVPFLIMGIVVAIALVLTCAVVGKRWGTALGWVLQVVLILMGLFEPMMFVVGALFLLSWAYAMWQGTKIDLENAARAEEQAQWEAEHPEG